MDEREQSGVRLRPAGRSFGDWDIRTIVPAYDGWRAVLENDDGTAFAVPIVCWALLRASYEEPTGEKGIDTDVVPMVAEVKANEPTGVGFIHHSGNFVGVAAPGEPPELILAQHRGVLAYEEASVATEEEAAPTRT